MENKNIVSEGEASTQTLEPASPQTDIKKYLFWPVLGVLSVFFAVVIAMLFSSGTNDDDTPVVVENNEVTQEQTNEATVVPEMTIAEKYSQLESLSASEVTTEVEAREQVLDSLESTQETSPETRQKKIDILDTL